MNTDSIVEAVIAKHRERAARGLAQYGTTMDRTDLTPVQWLQHLQDELMDAAVYAEKEIRRTQATDGHRQGPQPSDDDPIVVGEAATFYPDAPPSPPTLQKPDAREAARKLREELDDMPYDDEKEMAAAVRAFNAFAESFHTSSSEGLRRENERLKERIGKLGWLLSGVDSQTFVGDNHERLIELAAQRIRELESDRNDLSDRQRADQYEVNLLRGQVAALESSRDAAVKERDEFIKCLDGLAVATELDGNRDAGDIRRAFAGLVADRDAALQRAEKAEGELERLDRARLEALETIAELALPLRHVYESDSRNDAELIDAAVRGYCTDKHDLVEQINIARKNALIAQTEVRQWGDKLDAAWRVIANVSGGNWELQNDDWRAAAMRWRDDYWTVMKLTPPVLSSPPPAPATEPPAPVGFKKGDVVEVVNDRNLPSVVTLTKGQHITVDKVDDDGWPDINNWLCDPDRFRLISSPPKVSEKEVLETPEQVAARSVENVGLTFTEISLDSSYTADSVGKLVSLRWVQSKICREIERERTHFQSKLDRAREVAKAARELLEPMADYHPIDGDWPDDELLDDEFGPKITFGMLRRLRAALKDLEVSQ